MPRHEVMIETLSRKGHRVDVLAWRRSTEGSFPTRKDWIYITARASVGRKSTVFGLPLMLLRFCRALRLLRQDGGGDVLVITHLLQMPVSFRQNRALLYDSIDLFSVEMSLHFRSLGPYVCRALEVVEGVLLRRFDGIWAVDSRNDTVLKRLQKSCPNTQAIWNVPSLCQGPSPESRAAARRFVGDKFTIVYTGTIMYDKGVDIVARAIARLRDRVDDLQLVLIGNMWEDRSVFEGRLAVLGILDRVRVVDRIDYNAMLSYLECCHVAVALYKETRQYVGLSAGNSRKIFTYMQAGLPIIGPSFGEIGDMVRRVGCGVLVDPQDVDGVADAIETMWRNEEDRVAMAQTGREAFQTRYNWETEEVKFLQVFERALSSRRRETSPEGGR